MIEIFAMADNLSERHGEAIKTFRIFMCFFLFFSVKPWHSSTKGWLHSVQLPAHKSKSQQLCSQLKQLRWVIAMCECPPNVSQFIFGIFRQFPCLIHWLRHSHWDRNELMRKIHTNSQRDMRHRKLDRHKYTQWGEEICIHWLDTERYDAQNDKHAVYLFHDYV